MESVRITLAFYWKKAMSYRWLVLVPAAIVFACATVYASMQRDVYQAEAVLIRRMSKPSDGIIRSAVVRSARDLVSSIGERMLSYEVLYRIAEDHNLYPKMREKQGTEAVVRALRSKITIRNDGRTGTIRVSLQMSEGAQPNEKAAAIINDLIDQFSRTQEDMLTNESATLEDFLEESEAELLRKVEVRQRELNAFKLENLGRLPEDRNANLSAVRSAETLILSIEQNRERLESQLKMLAARNIELRNRLREHEDGLVDDVEISALKRIVAELKSRLASEGLIYADDSEHIKALETRLKLAEDQLAEAIATRKASPDAADTSSELQVYLLETNEANLSDARDDLRACDGEVERARQAMADARERIRMSREIEPKYASLHRAVADAEARRNSIRGKREEAAFQVSYQDHDPANPIQVHQRAMPMGRPIGPKRIPIALAGLMGGLALGVGLVFVRIKLDTSLRRDVDLRLLLPGAVVVTLPDVMSVGRRTGRALSQLILGIVLLAIVAAAVGVFGLRMEWWGSPDILERISQFTPWA